MIAKPNALTVFVLLLIGLFSLAVFAQNVGLPYPSSTKPSVDKGRQVYAQACSSCHGRDGQGGSAAKPDFSAAGWSSEYAPAEVAAAALGQGANHSAATSDAASAWHATAYVWTLPLSVSEVETGETEVDKAASKLKKGGLGLLITKGGEIRDLKDASWVMTHSDSAIVELITDLAADEYNALNQEHQDALIDYIYASHFALPSGWTE